MAVNSLGEMMIASRHGNFPVKTGDKIAGTRIIPLVIEKEKMDAAEKAADYKKLQTILAEEAASAFIQVPANTTAFNKNLAGYKFYPIYVQDMSTVYFVK